MAPVTKFDNLIADVLYHIDVELQDPGTLQAMKRVISSVRREQAESYTVVFDNRTGELISLAPGKIEEPYRGERSFSDVYWTWYIFLPTEVELFTETCKETPERWVLDLSGKVPPKAIDDARRAQEKNNA